MSCGVWTKDSRALLIWTPLLCVQPPGWDQEAAGQEGSGVAAGGQVQNLEALEGAGQACTTFDYYILYLLFLYMLLLVLFKDSMLSHAV